MHLNQFYVLVLLTLRAMRQISSTKNAKKKLSRVALTVEADTRESPIIYIMENNLYLCISSASNS